MHFVSENRHARHHARSSGPSTMRPTSDTQPCPDRANYFLKSERIFLALINLTGGGGRNREVGEGVFGSWRRPGRLSRESASLTDLYRRVSRVLLDK
jgi:hypothetical protein